MVSNKKKMYLLLLEKPYYLNFRVQNTKCKMQNTKCEVLNAKQTLHLQTCNHVVNTKHITDFYASQ